MRAENQQLREQLAQALALIAHLQKELEQLRAGLSGPPSLHQAFYPQAQREDRKAVPPQASQRPKRCSS